MYSGAPGSTTDVFTVSGSHTYGEEGSYTITTTINHEGGKFIYSNAADFSVTNNPNGVWSYGEFPPGTNPGVTPTDTTFTKYGFSGKIHGFDFVGAGTNGGLPA